MSETAAHRHAVPQLTLVRPDLAAAQSAGSIVAILDRIEEAIELETGAINSDPRFDIKASNARKGRYLYELNRAMKGIAVQDLGDGARDGIIRLRHKLVANEAAILAHLGAVTEVAALLQDVIQRADADGTYSTSAFSEGARA